MPVALLLTNVLVTFQAAAKALKPWTSIVPLESTIVARARGAFLVHWFGAKLPLDGLAVRAYIVNTHELAERFALAKRSVPSSPGGPNLLTPLAGFAGMLAGVLLSPIGAIAGIWALWKVMGFNVKTFFVALAWWVIPRLPVLGAVFGVALVGGLSDRRDLRSLYDVTGSLARFFNATLVFLDQLLGLRANVRNPLLRQILHLSDQIGPLLAQTLGTVAFTVLRFGPLLPSLATMIAAIRGLVTTTGLELKRLLGDLANALKGLKSPIVDVVEQVAGAAKRPVRRISDVITNQLNVLVEALSALGQELSGQFFSSPHQPGQKETKPKFLAIAGDYIAKFTLSHFTVRVIRALVEMITRFVGYWKALPEKPEEESLIKLNFDSFINALADPFRAPIEALDAAPQELPTIADVAQRERIAHAMDVSEVAPLDMESIKAVAADLGRARPASEHLQLAPEARAALEGALRRGGVLAQERAQVPAAVMPLLQPGFEKLRQALGLVVGRVMPPWARVYAPQLDEALRAIDRHLYGVEPGPAPKYPVLDVPTDTPLLPKIKTLMLRAPGRDKYDVSDFETLVLKRLRDERYTIAGPEPVAARGR